MGTFLFFKVFFERFCLRLSVVPGLLGPVKAKNRGSILLGSTVEGLFYILALGVIISGIMVISALNPMYIQCFG